jgi:hypothetical protein
MAEYDDWDAIADGIDDLQRIVDEQLERLPEGVRAKTVERLKGALDTARTAADDIEDEKKEKE